MSASRAQLGAGRIAALLVVAAALIPTVAFGTSYADDPTPTPSPVTNDDAPAQVLVTSLGPRAPINPDEFFRVTGRIVNRGSQPLQGLTVRLRRGARLESRSELAAADTDPPATPTRVGRTPVRTAVQDLAPGASTTFDIRIRVSQLNLDQGLPGVYPLKIEARASFGANGEVSPAGNVLTYVPWFPDGPPTGKIRIAWLWPVVDQPRRGPREVMLDDDLATSFSPGGRLDRLVRAAEDGAKGGCDPAVPGPTTLPPRPRTTVCRGESVPVTYAVDPDLLFTADALTKPYLVQQSGDKTKRVDNTAPATQWLKTLRDATAGADVLSLPYADPDVVALTRSEIGLADEVPLLRELGKQETTRLLGHAPMTSVVWPPPGHLTRRAVESLTSGGATAVAIDPVALPAPESDPNPTPGTRVGQLPTSTGQPTLMTIDPTLSALLAPPTGADYPGDRIVEQRWLAETAMISAEAPSISRTLLVAPPRRADLHTAVAADALRDTGRLPWLCPVSLASVAAGTEACTGQVQPEAKELPAVELEPTRPGDRQLSDTFLSEVHTLRRQGSQFSDEILAEPTSGAAVRTTGRLLRARARTESSAWRDDAPAGLTMLKQLRADLDDLRGRVHLQVGGTVTLTSSTGVIQVNVVNTLDQPVRVGVLVDPRNRARLTIRDTPVTTVAPGQARQVNVRVRAQTSGKFPVLAQLVDRDGNPFGNPSPLVVRSTQYGRVALAVTGIGAGVLLVAAGLRIVRRALQHGAA